jgi:rare lipoprotein A
MRASGLSRCCLLLGSLWVSTLLFACGSASTATRSPRAHVPSEFDPRAYYSRRALSVQRGQASFYADFFAGRRTANGEIYEPNAYTAAHRSLPFGSVLRVTRVGTGDWVLVRVNDRGPYGPRTRVIDLSKQAAKRLSMLHDGVVSVRLEILEMGPH